MIDQTIARLIALGQSEDLDDPHPTALLESFRHQGDLNRLHWESWYAATAACLLDELVALAKSLTVLDVRYRFDGWGAGSVAAVIWVFRMIQRRDPDLADQLANWILPRTTNPWVPFGSDNLGARSAAEYRALREERRKWREANIETERRRQAEAKIRRAIREEQKAKNHAARMELQRTKTQKRRRLIAELNAFDPAERLRLLARDREHPLEYYPTAYLVVDRETLGKLERGILSLLADRTQHYRTGALRQLHDKIAEILSP